MKVRRFTDQREKDSIGVGTPHRKSGLSARQLLASEIALALIVGEDAIRP